MIPIPKIALVGRPNVGKSTLFNRICGRRKAITDSRPGSTRDRNYAQTSWQGAAFELIDTGGLLLGTDDPLLGPAARPGRAGDRARRTSSSSWWTAAPGCCPTTARSRPACARRASGAGRGEQAREDQDDAARSSRALGFDRDACRSRPSTASASATCWTRRSRSCRGSRSPEDEETPLRIALVGRPNVGKSSLLNRFLGEERAVVSPIPGTTRDAVDSLLDEGRPALPVRGHRGHPASRGS